MYVCMYVFMYVCIYVCVYVCMYICMCMYVCIYVTGFGKIGLNAANNFFSVSPGKALCVDFFRNIFYGRNG